MGKRPAAIIVPFIILAFFFIFAGATFVRYLAVIFLLIHGFSLIQFFLVPRFIRVYRLTDKLNAIRRQNMTVTIRVENHSPFPIPYMSVVDNFGGLFADGGSFLITLGPFEAKEVSYTCHGQTRGDYRLGPVVCKGADLLGYLPWQRAFDAEGHAIVYPTIYSLELVNDKGLPAGSLSIEDKLYEDITRFRSMREYIAGDDMKRINWKASAKTGSLYTMEFDSTLYFPVYMVMNVCKRDYPQRFRESLMERAIETCASLTFYFTGLKQDIGLLSTGETTDGSFTVVPCKPGYEHAMEILELLARTSARDASIDLETVLYRSGMKASVGARVMVVTPRLKEEQARVLIGAKRRGMNIEIMEIEASMEKMEEDFVKNILRVMPVRAGDGEIVHG